MKVMEASWVKHWILDLLSQETIEQKSFPEWIKGFEDRYYREEIRLMEYFYNQRRDCYGEVKTGTKDE